MSSRLLRPAGAVVATVSLALLVFACSTPEARYETLNFFFDGVPAPPGMNGDSEVSPEQRLSPFQKSMRAMAVQQAPVNMMPESIHQPYRERNCRACHQITVPQTEDLPHDATMCDQCHKVQRIEEGWDHGPINLGHCVPCHTPHSSAYPKLLTMPMPEVCLHCHKEVSREPEYHAVDNYDACVHCHDPHRMY